MAQQIKKKFLSQEIINYFDDQIINVGGSVSSEQSRAEGQEAAIRSEFASADEAKLLEAKAFAEAQDALKLSEAKEYAELKVAEVKSEIMGGIPSSTLDTITEIAEALASEQTATGAILTKLGELEAADAAEVLARDAAISVAVMAEQQAREAFDGLLQSSLEQEIADREEVDEELSQRIDSTATSLMGTIGAVNDRAIAAEQELQSQITSNFESLESNIADVEENLSGMIAQELVERQSGDASTLQASKDYTDAQIAAIPAVDLSNYYTKSQVDTKEAALQAQIDALDTGFVTEAELASAVDSLESQIDDLDGYAQELRSDLDDLDGYAQELRSDLDQEISDRQSADSELSSRISVLEAKGFSKGVVTVGAELAFIDLDRQYGMLLSVSVGRLMVHEGEDFTVSVVDGKTRLTWIGSLLSPSGEEAIEAGDKVFFSGAF